MTVVFFGPTKVSRKVGLLFFLQYSSFSDLFVVER